MSRKKPRIGYRWAKWSDFYVTPRYEFGQTWHIVRVKGRMGVWLGAYRSERAAIVAINTAVHHHAVDVPVGAMDHPLFVEPSQVGR